MILSRRTLLTGSLATAAAAVVPSPPFVTLPPGEYTVVIDSLTAFGEYSQREAAKAMLYGRNYGMSAYHFKRALETPSIVMNLRVVDTEDAFRRFAGTRVGLRRIGETGNKFPSTEKF